jgi:hypothetical protein
MVVIPAPSRDGTHLSMDGDLCAAGRPSISGTADDGYGNIV